MTVFLFCVYYKNNNSLPGKGMFVLNKITNANKLIKYIAETSFSKKGAGAWAQISKNLVFDFVNKNYSLTGGSDSETDLFYLIVTNYLSNGNDGYTDLKNYDKLLMDIPCQNATIDYIKYLNNVSYTTNYTRIIQ